MTCTRSETETDAIDREEIKINSPPCDAEAITSQPNVGKSKWAINENEELMSSLEHRLWTFGSMAIMSGSLVQAGFQAQAVGEMGWLAVGTALLSSYVLSDLGTGIYHWSVDNYGDGQTPLVGKQIAAFQVGGWAGNDEVDEHRVVSFLTCPPNPRATTKDHGPSRSASSATMCTRSSDQLLSPRLSFSYLHPLLPSGGTLSPGASYS